MTAKAARPGTGEHQLLRNDRKNLGRYHCGMALRIQCASLLKAQNKRSQLCYAKPTH